MQAKVVLGPSGEAGFLVSSVSSRPHCIPGGPGVGRLWLGSLRTSVGAAGCRAQGPLLTLSAAQEPSYL